MRKPDDLNRLKKLLFGELNIPDGGLELLKTDLAKLLQSYFELIDDSLAVTLEPDADGNFDIAINAKAIHIRELKFFN